MLAHLEEWLHDDAIGEPLAECFDLARKAGMSIRGVISIYDGVATETPTTLGGNLIKNSLISFCCANGARIIADTEFANRDDADAVRVTINNAFIGIEEIAADSMDSTTYMAMIRLHAATTQFIVDTAQPLPRVVLFRFAAPLPTLHAAHRLYDNAGRCDELRAENKVVHPAFMRPTGRALSA